jgi:tyrosine-protein phosphatase YwqE
LGNQIITTPHIIQHVWDNSQEDIEALSTITKSNLETENILIPFKAAEYLMDDPVCTSFNQKSIDKRQLCLSGDVLHQRSNTVVHDTFDLQVAGYTQYCASERYLFYQNNFDEYKKTKRAGCLFQLNLLSVVGYYGGQINKTAENC